MRKRIAALVIGVAALAMSAVAQVTGSGTSGTVPVFTGTTTLGNSPITITGSSSNVGIGGVNTVTFDQLTVLSPAGGGGVGTIGKVDPNEGNWSWSELSTWINNPLAPTPNVDLWNIGSEGNYANNGTLSTIDMYVYDARTGAYNIFVDGSDNVYVGGNSYPYGAGTAALYASAAGKVGIGTTTPQYSLDVSGKIHTSTAVVFPDGSQQITAWTGTVCGGDYAESVDVTGIRTSYEPGDVLVIDPDTSGRFLKSAEPYSTSVTGVYSTKPGFVGRRQGDPNSPDAVPMAMIGIVPTKVSAENGPIHPGDLLVTSSTLGFAMKGTDRSKMLGAVIGKALGNLDSGSGVIEVVVMFQ